jgi:hypothetical protein
MNITRPERERRHRRHVADPEALRVPNCGRNTNLQQQGHCGAVARRPQRRTHAHRPATAVVIRQPVALERLHRRVQRRDHHRRRESLLDRGRVDKRLECGARLTARLRRAVEMASIEVSSAHHRAHFAGNRIHRDQRRLQRI